MKVGLPWLARPLLQLIVLISRIGADPTDTVELRVQKAIQVNTVVLGGLPFQFGIVGLFVALGAYTSALCVSVFALTSLGSLLWLAATPRHYPVFRFVQLLIAVVSPVSGTLLMGGLLPSGLVQIWGLVAPLLALVFYTPRQAVAWLLFFITLLVVANVAALYLPPVDQLPAPVVLGIALTNIIVIASMMFASLYYFVYERDRAYQLLRGEQEKSENLLLNILPPEIAAILKDEQRVIANHHAEASILFADVVNFTPLSTQLTPAELVGLLNEVFSHFDGLVEKYGLEKIKTIGDCYMVAGGVPRPRADHAQAIVRLALEMQAFVAGREFRGRRLAFRIGINSGPVVAGVIGRKKFIYDLWGDAVNTASRMESHGQGEVIQITRATYELIKAEFVCEPRGYVNVKGKGEMEVWQVVAPRVAGE